MIHEIDSRYVEEYIQEVFADTISRQIKERILNGLLSEEQVVKLAMEYAKNVFSRMLENPRGDINAIENEIAFWDSFVNTFPKYPERYSRQCLVEAAVRQMLTNIGTGSSD